jgi:hypothetical protein
MEVVRSRLCKTEYNNLVTSQNGYSFYNTVLEILYCYKSYIYPVTWSDTLLCMQEATRLATARNF